MPTDEEIKRDFDELHKNLDSIKNILLKHYIFIGKFGWRKYALVFVSWVAVALLTYGAMTGV